MAIVTSYTKVGVDALLAPLQYISFSRKTADYTLVDTDDHKCIEMNVATANELIVPQNSDEVIPIGAVIGVIQRGVGVTTIVPGVSVTLNSLTDSLISYGQNAHIYLHKVAANEWYVYGDLALNISFLTKTSDYTLDLDDYYPDMCIEMDAAIANDLTIPLNADAAIPIGAVINVIQKGVGETTIVPDSSVTLYSLNDYLTSAGQYARIRLQKAAQDEWYVDGDLVA